MVGMDTAYPLIMVADVDRASAFYAETLAWEISVDLGWFRLLANPDRPHAQVAVIDRHHESIPASERGRAPSGFLFTVDVDDCDVVHRRAVAFGAEVVVPARDEPWGQRHTMLRDPDGTLVDVVVAQ